jgi:hypothetical protein
MLKRGGNLKATLEAHGNKATMQVMKVEAAKIGLGGSTVQKYTMCRHQRGQRARDNEDYEKQFEELPRWFRRLFKQNSGYCAIATDDEGVFEYAFLTLGPVQDAIKASGRPVCSTDFGHMKHDFFGGLNATGMFQPGDGRLLHLWSAVFAESNGSTYLWETCAKHIEAAGLAHFYGSRALP